MTKKSGFIESKIRIAVLVSGGGTNLQALIDAQKSGAIKSAKIVAVISNNRDAYALERAETAGIKNFIVPKSGENAETEILHILDTEKIDLIVLAGFMMILSEKFTSRYAHRIINVHPSLIPSFCGKGFYGLRVHEAALGYGVKLTGATVHFVNEIPDGGAIIMQKAVAVQEGDDAKTLQARVMKEAEHIILPRAVEAVAAEMLAEKQPNA